MGRPPASNISGLANQFLSEMRLRMDNKDLLEAINQVMPYGKYKGRQLLDLPEPYLVWYHSKGFPQGKLGTQLALMYEVKLNGLEGMLRRFQR
jgi:uncharacterized protein (DUF3820 family)